MSNQMSSELEFMPQKRLLTTEEYEKIVKAGVFEEDERLELINGEIITMVPPGWPHVNYVNRITRILTKLLPEDFTVSLQNPIQLNSIHEPQPDAAVYYGQDDNDETKACTAENARLVIEVSDSSLKYDRKVKLNLYASANIPEFWIIDIQGKRIEVYSEPTPEGRYQVMNIFHIDDELVSPTIPFLRFAVNAVVR